MIADGLRRAVIVAGYWPLTVAGLLVVGVLSLSETQWWIETDEMWPLVPMVAALAACFVIFYFQSRRAGQPVEGEAGAFASWFGWLVLGILPALLIMLVHISVIGLDEWNERIEGSHTESLIDSVGILLGTPMIVVSAGRAINASGPSSFALMAATLRHAIPILVAVIVLSVLPGMLASTLAAEVRSETLPVWADFGFAIVEVLFFFANSLLTVGVYASIYRHIERECVPLSTD